MKKSIIVLVLITILVLAAGCGRTKSRYLGKEHRQVLKVNNLSALENVVCCSFDKRGRSTVKDVTFLGSDGYYYTQEFKDVSPFEGIIRWVPFDQEDSFIQSRAISRWTGRAVNLKLPEDFSKLINIDVGYGGGNERTKNLVYLSVDGKIYAKEYREGLINRNFGGWLEIQPGN